MVTEVCSLLGRLPLTAQRHAPLLLTGQRTEDQSRRCPGASPLVHLVLSTARAPLLGIRDAPCQGQHCQGIAAMHESIRTPLQSEDSDSVTPFPERGTLETQRPEESSSGLVAAVPGLPGRAFSWDRPAPAPLTLSGVSRSCCPSLNLWWALAPTRCLTAPQR